MRSSIVLALLVTSATGCTGLGQSNAGLPSLQRAAPTAIRIAQVPASMAHGRSYPFFIACAEDCPVPSDLSGAVLPDHGRSLESEQTGDATVVHTVQFAFASAEIEPHEADRLRQLVDDLTGQPLLITGHTDSTVSTTPRISNRELALDRAVAVKRFLLAAGIPETAITLAAQHLCCYVASNNTESGRRSNRRAVITVRQSDRSHP